VPNHHIATSIRTATGDQNPKDVTKVRTSKRMRSKRQTQISALHHFQFRMLFKMKILLLINILVCLAQSQIPPRLQDHLLSMDLGFTPVDYNGNHPFERRRKLENEDYDTIELEYLDSGSYYESLRIKFMTDPIKGSATYNSLFEDTLQEVSLQYNRQC
jgi:hypothetical protein